MKQYSVIFLACLMVMQASGYSIPGLSEVRIADYSKQYQREQWQTLWLRRGVKTGVVAGVALLSYSAAKGYLFGKQAQKEEVSRLVRLYEAMSRKQRSLLEGAATLILDGANKKETRSWLDRSYIKDQLKNGVNYTVKDLLPGLAATPLIGHLFSIGVNKMNTLFEDRTVQWFVMTRTNLLPLCDELKKTAAYLDPTCQIFDSMKSLEFLMRSQEHVDPKHVDPQMQGMMFELMQLNMLACAGKNALESDKERAYALFFSQMVDLMHELEKIIGFMHSKLAFVYTVQNAMALENIKKTVNNYSQSLTAVLNPPLKDKGMESDEDQSLLATVMMLVHHISQTVSA
ncbi:MAG: hypothetical protein WD068_01185 [Candidatus Babeliales bacterium]